LLLPLIRDNGYYLEDFVKSCALKPLELAY